MKNETNKNEYNELITKQELAKRLNCHTRTIDKWRETGVLMPIKIGAFCRYDWEEVVEHFKSKRDKN
jgi:DNA-binding transcriptional MerR regulator